MFLEMSPVACERFLTEEELAECRRRAERPKSWFLARLGLGWLGLAAIYSLLLFDIVWLRVTAVALGNLLAIVVVSGTYMLWRAYLETKRLSNVDKTTLVYKFLTNGYWKSYNLPTFLYPPPEIEVMYPQNLAIRSGGPLWRVFRPVQLVIIEDLPQAEPGTSTRAFTELERMELEKHLAECKKSIRFGLFVLPLAIAGCIWEFARYDGGWPTLLMLALPLGILSMIVSIRSDLRRNRWLKWAIEAGSVSIEWNNDVSTEWLVMGDLEWREGGEPARWRRCSGNGLPIHSS
jgi:hypothetical protein